MAAILYNKTDSDWAVLLNIASTELKDLYMYLYDLSGIEGLYNFKLCVKTVQYYVFFFFFCFTPYSFEGSFLYGMYYKCFFW